MESGHRNSQLNLPRDDECLPWYEWDISQMDENLKDMRALRAEHGGINGNNIRQIERLMMDQVALITRESQETR